MVLLSRSNRSRILSGPVSQGEVFVTGIPSLKAIEAAFGLIRMKPQPQAFWRYSIALRNCSSS